MNKSLQHQGSTDFYRSNGSLVSD